MLKKIRYTKMSITSSHHPRQLYVLRMNYSPTAIRSGGIGTQAFCSWRNAQFIATPGRFCHNKTIFD
jgi:hypothetical protein